MERMEKLGEARDSGFDAVSLVAMCRGALKLTFSLKNMGSKNDIKIIFQKSKVIHQMC